jgi:hypothetical protein
VFDAVGVDIALFDLIAAYDWHPQERPKFFRKSGFSRSRSACDDDALWFSVHVSGCPTPELTGPEELHQAFNLTDDHASLFRSG